MKTTALCFVCKRSFELPADHTCGTETKTIEGLTFRIRPSNVGPRSAAIDYQAEDGKWRLLILSNRKSAWKVWDENMNVPIKSAQRDIVKRELRAKK